MRLAEDIAGGLMVTMPSEKDFTSDTVVGRNGETIGEICNKFFAGRDGVSTQDRQKILRFLENICLGAAPSATAPSPCTAQAPRRPSA